MKKRIFLSLLFLLSVFATGAGVAIHRIATISGSLGRLLQLHQVEHLRQNLIINVQTVQADLYRVRSPLGANLDLIVENVATLDEAAVGCGGCHHAPQVAGRIVEMRGLIDDYKNSLSYYITAAADAERIEALRREGISVGDRLLRLTQEMAFAASLKLQEATSAALVKINRAKTILFVTLALACLLALSAAMYLVRFLTRPVDALLGGTRAIQSGQLGYTISYHDRSEFGELAENFNAMSLALKEGYANLTRQQQALRESEWKFRTLSDFAHDWEYWLGTQGEVVYSSKPCQEVTGYSGDEFAANPRLLGQIVHAEDRDVYEAHLAGGLSTGPKALEYRIVTKSGDVKWMSHLCGPIYVDGQFLGRFASNRDITDRKHLEDKLIQSQKMESLGLMAGGIAHDFNNLLTAILGYASLLEVRVEGSDEKTKKAVEQIIRAGERAQELTGSLLAFSRKQIMRPRTVDMNEIVSDLKELLVRIIGEDLELKILCSEGRLLVQADPHQLDHVLINLATNARDAMPQGGELEIQTSVEPVHAEGSGPGGAGARDYVVVTVRDTGSGVDPKDLPHIFEPFFTTKDKHKGTGLGLSTVHGIVEQQGGFVEVRSELGKGTVFRILLPKAEETAVEDADAEATTLAAAHSAGSGTVLVAEDEASVRDYVQEVLEAHGYKTVLAVDGVDAIEKFEGNRQSIDLVLLDVVMPRKNGKEVYEHIKKAKPLLPVAFMSGYTKDILTSRGIHEEGLHVLQKPLKAASLLEWARNRTSAPPTPPL